MTTREDWTPEDRQIVDDAYILEDMQQNSRGYAIIKDWLVKEKNKALNVENLDMTKSAEDLKIDVAVNRTKRKLIDDLEKFIVRKITDGKNLEMQLLNS